MVSAVIVAAGRGTRMGPDVDKLFLELEGEPVIAHTWRRFDSHPEVDEVVLVVRQGMQAAFEEIAKDLALRKPYKLTVGGKERQDSVWNGLQAVSKGTHIVAIQDGARPCTSKALISVCIAAASESGAAVAAFKVTDTIKSSDDGRFISTNVDRSKLWSVQTPQTFRLEIILRALEEVKTRGLLVTDDTAACELIGQKVRLVESSDPNPKVTIRADIPFVETILRQQRQSIPS